MCEPRRFRLPLLVLCLAVFCPGQVFSGPKRDFGDISITVTSEPRGTAAHGYSEYIFTLTNRSTERGHTVTLTIPAELEVLHHDDYIRSITRTVQIEPKTTLQVSLLHPDFPDVGGEGLKVSIDGREQDGAVPLAVTSSRGHSYGYGREYGYGRRRHSSHSRSYYGDPENGPLVLVGQRVGENFQRDVRFIGFDFLGGDIRGMPGAETTPILSEEPVATWSSRWLGYSRYDAVVLTRDELEGLARGPADGQAIRAALFQYVEAGGTLLVLDAGSLTLPSSWKRNREVLEGSQTFHGGFGLCFQMNDREMHTWPPTTRQAIVAAWSQTGLPYQNHQSLREANAGLPIVEDIGLPVRGLFVLILLFTIAIGPLNLWLLARWKRRIWLLWTTPVIAFLTCTAVFGFMIVAEGWQGRTRVVAFTVLDETEQRATTLGWAANYSPLTPSDGLHFSQDTEVTLQGLDDDQTSNLVCDLDWTRDQHMRRGWISARMPTYFQLRRSEGKRLERLPVSHEPDGSFQVTNQLGASIRELWVADEKGKIYSAKGVDVGQRATLTPTGKTVFPGNAEDSRAGKVTGLRRLYINSKWANLGTEARQMPEAILTPRTYLAVLESSPFLESGLVGAISRQTDSYVFGLMAE